MSRMIAYASGEAMSADEAMGRDVLRRFAELSRLHADGWGTAWVDATSGVVRVSGGASVLAVEDLCAAVSAPSTARIVYLRFASRGAPPSPENRQPFLRDGIAFQHNGLLAPRDRLAVLLDGVESSLHGDTDSEVYFAVIRAAMSIGDRLETSSVRAAVTRVRDAFPHACLNAMMLMPRALHVVYAAGTVAVPLEAFRARGVDLTQLPPEHDDQYNVMRTSVSATGAQVIATSGLGMRSWEELEPETVHEWSTIGRRR